MDTAVALIGKIPNLLPLEIPVWKTVRRLMAGQFTQPAVLPILTRCLLIAHRKAHGA
jgi:hypothetical protein